MDKPTIYHTANETDIVIIGGGHAGCEAALASARMGMRTVMLALSLDQLAMMPCNPNIGGTSKGHLVREIDALGGEMGKNIDKTFIQSKMLNTGKGPAVHSLRAQADKSRYSAEMRRVLEAEPNLLVKQAEAADIVTEDGKVTGVLTTTGVLYPCRCAVICTGTYLRARCLTGEAIVNCGPNGLKQSVPLAAALERLGIRLMRFKTGTPARVDGSTLDYTRMAEQKGDEEIIPFSFTTDPEAVQREQVSCWLTYTNTETHRIIHENIHRSPMYAGVIEGTGTRYCPSIEDKVVRFADKDRHQVFIEPEGEDTTEMYISGMSTSLPEDVQLAMYRSVPGMENAELTRTGYAIEYDCIDATQLRLSLEFARIEGLFSAGQFNGSSGYEEAAAQGIIAGINAARRAKNQDMFVLDRSEAYIGVLIDDLVTKGSREPYRMMTSRAEYRLLLRQDNADLRLTERGYEAGLAPQSRRDAVIVKKESITAETKRVMRVNVAPSAAADKLMEAHSSTPFITGIKLAELMRRPELDYEILAALDAERPALPRDVREQVNIVIKYQGYIERQEAQVAQFKKWESRKLPESIRYEDVPNLRLEARQKLEAIRPESVGHASRITGVSPADITVLLVHLERQRGE